MIYLQLLWTFFKIGALTFGGGYAMLPLIQSETLANGWATEEEIINFIAVSESTPGPFAINMATYIGTSQGGVLGAFLSTLGVVLPSFIIILIVARCYEKFKTNRFVAGAMTGLKPAVVGLIGAAVLSVGKTVFVPENFSTAIFKTDIFYMSAILFIAMTVLAFKKVHPIIIICISAVVGIAAGYAFGM
ncbi:MAG: chromate transporter [Clostridia bacterium]|nr:chromate transporter [Clostridia bacterium]